MNVTIVDEKTAPLFSRKEIAMDIIFEKSTPSKEELKKYLATLKKADENLVVVKKIYTKFGYTTASALAYVYDNLKSKELGELKTRKQRRDEKKAREDAAKAAAEAKAAAPAEEKKGE